MGFFSSVEFNSLEELLVDQVKDLYDAEHQILVALPKMIEKATCMYLKKALSDHLSETKTQVVRLERVFQIMGHEPERETCDAMKGLMAEGKKVLDADGDSDVLNAALIAAAQRVEHYEMAGYGTARSFARQLGMHEVANILQETLDEEGQADKKLTEIAEQSVNPASAEATA